MWWHLLITLSLAALAIVVLTEVEINYNYRRIIQDGSKDSLRQAFHNARATVRIVVVGAIMLGAAWPAWHDWKAWAMSLGAVFFWVMGWVPYRFNTGLNLKRGLDKYYVSFATWASRWDKWFVKQTMYIKLKGIKESDKQTLWYGMAICSHKWVLIGLRIWGFYQFVDLSWHAIVRLQ